MGLDQFRIASPCRADWDAMRGDDRVRFCTECSKNVYNLSAMTRPEAEALVVEKEAACVPVFINGRMEVPSRQIVRSGCGSRPSG